MILSEQIEFIDDDIESDDIEYFTQVEVDVLLTNVLDDDDEDDDDDKKSTAKAESQNKNDNKVVSGQKKIVKISGPAIYESFPENEIVAILNDKEDASHYVVVKIVLLIRDKKVKVELKKIML